MSAIGSVNSFASDIFSRSLANSSGRAQSSAPDGLAAPARSDASSSNDRDPATRLDLSDKVKDILARAGNDQDVADLSLIHI